MGENNVIAKHWFEGFWAYYKRVEDNYIWNLIIIMGPLFDSIKILDWLGSLANITHNIDH